MSIESEHVPSYLLRVYTKWTAHRCAESRLRLAKCYAENTREGPWACEAEIAQTRSCEGAETAKLVRTCETPLHEWSECFRKDGDFALCRKEQEVVSECTRKAFNVDVDNWEERYYSRPYPIQ